MTKRIHVVAGIIYDDERQHILLSKRPDHLHKGGYWEFPGGKCEPGESESEALARELKEELNIVYKQAEHFQSLAYDYPEKSVHLSFWSVYGLCSEVQALENQQWRWVLLSELTNYQFPEANEPIVQTLLSR